MNEDTINKLKALLDAGTQGEWVLNPYLSTLVASPVNGEQLAAFGGYDEALGAHVPYPNGEKNAALIVALHNHAPALLEAARENMRLREALNDAADWVCELLPEHSNGGSRLQNLHSVLDGKETA